MQAIWNAYPGANAGRNTDHQSLPTAPVIDLPSASELLTYEAAHKILIRKQHGSAIRSLPYHLEHYHNFSATSRAAIVAQHCNEKHGWRSSTKARRQWTDVKVQTFFPTSGLQRYFTVDVSLQQREQPAEQPSEQVTCSKDTQGCSDTQSVVQEYREAARRRERELETADDKVAKTDRLATLAIETRRWLKSVKRKEIEKRPLGRLQNPESQQRYAGYFRRFTCYVLRMLLANEASSDAAEALSSSEQDEGSESDDSASSSGAALELEDEQSQAGKMLELFSSFILQAIDDQPFSSGLIRFLAVLGIDEQTNRLRTADQFAFMLAGVVYCVRVLAAEIMLLSAHRGSQGIAQREEFLRMRKKYLTVSK
ncbi:hypothetical protein H2203_005265 [Taxawa tesnikishii (nom. ined.)]|nr:hypothetical protein H2203_005265 [Dothideales sp. JES 119]